MHNVIKGKGKANKYYRGQYLRKVSESDVTAVFNIDCISRVVDKVKVKERLKCYQCPC